MGCTGERERKNQKTVGSTLLTVQMRNEEWQSTVTNTSAEFAYVHEILVIAITREMLLISKVFRLFKDIDLVLLEFKTPHLCLISSTDVKLKDTNKGESAWRTRVWHHCNFLESWIFPGNFLDAAGEFLFTGFGHILVLLLTGNQPLYKGAPVGAVLCGSRLTSHQNRWSQETEVAGTKAGFRTQAPKPRHHRTVSAKSLCKADLEPELSVWIEMQKAFDKRPVQLLVVSKQVKLWFFSFTSMTKIFNFICIHSSQLPWNKQRRWHCYSLPKILGCCQKHHVEWSQ